MKKKLQKLALVLAAVMLVASLTACSSAPKNPACLGVWSHAGSVAVMKDYYYPMDSLDALTMAISDAITLFDDNTFMISSNMIVDYNGDGGWYTIHSGDTAYYGTYEEVSKDEELGETVIRIVSVTGAKGADYDTSSPDYASYEGKQGVDATMGALNGMELTLGTYGNMSGEFVFTRTFGAATPSTGN